MSKVYGLESFFARHQKKLEGNYPGINFSRLERELQDSFIFKLSYDLKSKLLSGDPLAYIFRQSFFYDSFFYVDDRVLIPRYETELLVHEGIKVVREGDRVCEVGVGSGAIAISLLKALKVNHVHMLGTDLCEKALEVAAINAYRHEFEMGNHTLKLKKADRLVGIEGEFDVVISNPPYIKAKEDSKLVHEKVHQFEPHKALYIEDTQYDLWFTDFFRDVYNKLKDGGYFLMEGHENHLQEQKSIAAKMGFGEACVLPDLTGRDRILKLRK